MKKIKYFSSTLIILVVFLVFFLFFEVMNGFDTFSKIFYSNNIERVLKFMDSNNLHCKDSRLIMSTPEMNDVEGYTIKNYK